MSTIVAQATAYGVSSISIVRLSGERALDIALNLSKRKNFKPRYATLSRIYDTKQNFLDEAIIIYFKAPFSYTGEDIIEFQTHGGVVVSNLIIEECLKLGARLANPGEFSKRAYLNNKMDLSKAESIQSIILAQNEDAIKILARTLKGDLKKFVDDLRANLIKTLAFVEVCIDYAEDDLPPNILEDTKNLLDTNILNLSNIVEISEQRKGLIDGFKIAIIGKPNVGKSSILNSILKFDRAIVSNIAGTTRDTIEESIKIGTHLVKIIDTAGIRSDAENIENIGIKYSYKSAKEADIILAIFDGSEKLNKEDEEILKICKGSDKKVFYIINKSDLQQKIDLKIDNVIKISAKRSTDKIIEELKKFLNTQNYDGLMFASNRQINIVKNSLIFLKNAKKSLKNNELEIFAFEINRAIKELEAITKQYENDELLDEIFSNFCLGK